MNNYSPRFTEEECKNNNHWFVPYNKGNVICTKCGRFAKVGCMYRKPDKTILWGSFAERR